MVFYACKTYENMLYSSMKGNKWYNSYDNFLTHLAIQLSYMAIFTIMLIQVLSVISGTSMEGTGKKRSPTTYIIQKNKN